MTTSAAIHPEILRRVPLDLVELSRADGVPVLAVNPVKLDAHEFRCRYIADRVERLLRDKHRRDQQIRFYDFIGVWQPSAEPLPPITFDNCGLTPETCQCNSNDD